MNAHTAQKDYASLGEVNKRLQELGLEAISQEGIQAVLQRTTRERFVQALNEASENPACVRFLKNVTGPAANDSPQGNQPEEAPAQNGQAAQQDGQTTNEAAQNQGPPSGNGRGEDATAQRKEFISHHVYGGKGALCWNVDQTTREEPTIRLEGAPSVGERQYNWSEKIAVQFTRDELTCVLLTLAGDHASFEAKNHGVGEMQGKKGFSIQYQQDRESYFVRVFQPGKAVAVPMTLEDAFTVMSLIARQMRKSKPWMSASDILVFARRTVGRRQVGGGNG